MNTMQRKLYSDAILDLITSLDNDMQSITGQADNALKELDDPTKDDYTAREKCVEYINQYVYTMNEILGIEGNALNNDYFYEIQLLGTGSVNYGAYVYGSQARYIKDLPGIYNYWFKKYGEFGWSNGDLGNRGKTLKTGKFLPEGDLLTSAGGDSGFYPNLYPERYLVKVPNSGFLHELEMYRVGYSILGQGVPFSYKLSNWREVQDKPTAVTITPEIRGYSYNFTGDSISESYWHYDAYSSYWTGTLKPCTMIPLFTEDESIVIFAKVSSCNAYWETITETYYSSSGSSGCSSGYSPSPTYYYYKKYHINMSFEVDPQDIPYYIEQVPHSVYENGAWVTKYENKKRYYKFYPMKKVNVSTNLRLKFASKIQTLIRNRVDSFYRSCQEPGDKNRYKEFLNIYSMSLNSGNYSSVFNNIPSLENFLRYRARFCHSIWSDWAIANAVNDNLNDRLNKDDGSLKSWYVNATSIDRMERDYYKKLNRKKDIFRKLLIQEPAEDFEGGNEMIIDMTPSAYYKSVFSTYPEFRVGDTVYIRDDEHNETMCTIINKEVVKIQDTAEVQYETVQRNDGKTEQVAKLDENGEPIAIYTYKNALKLTFSGNVPTIYDPDTLRIMKEL